MGISGLLPFLKKASRPVNVSELSGKVAAIDVYCWLHKGAFGCAEKLVQNQKTDGYVLYVMRYVDLLLFHNIKPILVFDGRNLPSKAATEQKRRENRSKYRKMARDYLQEGRTKEARECFQRCVDITPEMARDVIKACNDRNVDCIVAPYEADAQLAYLATTGAYADFVISEDSDLTLFGCENIVFKLDSGGNGILYEKKNLHLCLGQKSDNFTFEKFRYMGIMAGCDYLPSLHGIGLGKSCKFWGKVSNPNLHQVLPKIPAYLNMHQLQVTEEYVAGFVQANRTFLYQIVFDPREKKFRPLQDYPPDFDHDLSFAGEVIEPGLQLNYALGNLDIRTFEKVGDYRPGSTRLGDKTRYGKPVLSQRSIWDSVYDPAQGFEVVAEIPAAEKAKKKADVAIQNCFSKRAVAPVSKPEVKPDVKPDVKPELDVSLEESVAEIYRQNKPKEVVVSKYFGLPSPVPKRKSDFESPAPKRRRQEVEHSTPKSVRKKDWFESLDDEVTKDEKTLVYDVSKAAQKPFKPPSKVDPDAETTRKRNPFAKKSQSPVKENKSSLFNVKSPLKIASSQLCTQSLTDDVKGPVKPVVESPPKKSSQVKTFSDLSKTASSYFPAKGNRAKVSGLLKNKGQRSLLQMWGKK